MINTSRQINALTCTCDLEILLIQEIMAINKELFCLKFADTILSKESLIPTSIDIDKTFIS